MTEQIPLRFKGIVMSFRVNAASATPWQNLSVAKVQAQQKSVFGRLSTAQTVREQPAAIQLRTKNQQSARSAAVQQAGLQRLYSISQTADAWLDRIDIRLERMVELAEESQNGTVTDRTGLQTEFRTLQEEIAEIARDAKFGSRQLFDGSLGINDELSLVTSSDDPGARWSFPDLRGDSSSPPWINDGSNTWPEVIDGTQTDVNSSANAASAESLLEDARDYVSELREDLSEQRDAFDSLRETGAGLEEEQSSIEPIPKTTDDALEAATSAIEGIYGKLSEAFSVQANRLPTESLTLLLQSTSFSTPQSSSENENSSR